LPQFQPVIAAASTKTPMARRALTGLASTAPRG
jgi:hypothetical protein